MNLNSNGVIGHRRRVRHCARLASLARISPPIPNDHPLVQRTAQACRTVHERARGTDNNGAGHVESSRPLSRLACAPRVLRWSRSKSSGINRSRRVSRRARTRPRRTRDRRPATRQLSRSSQLPKRRRKAPRRTTIGVETHSRRSGGSTRRTGNTPNVPRLHVSGGALESAR